MAGAMLEKESIQLLNNRSLIQKLLPYTSNQFQYQFIIFFHKLCSNQFQYQVKTRFTRKSRFLFTTADRIMSLESLLNILMMFGMITLRCFLLILVLKLVLCFGLTLLTRS